MLDALLQEIRLLDVSKGPLRRFGYLIGGILLASGGWLGWKSDFSDLTEFTAPTGWHVLSAIGLLLVACAAAVPQLLRPIYYVWMTLAVVLGAVMTRVILSIVFVLLIVPAGLVMRAFRRDAFSRSAKKAQGSLWIRKSDPATSREQLEKYY